MCGIAGIIDFGYPGISQAACRNMWRSILHRGRDACGGISWGGNLAVREHDGVDQEFGRSMLFSSRLSIQDLSVQAKMPMADVGRKLWALQNGEIYNFWELKRELSDGGCAFRTQSDTEVILCGYQAWGFEGLLKRINGDFAIVLLDIEKRLLHLARDRFGVKPLYYSFRSGSFRFSSEIKALLQDDSFALRPNQRKIFSYLSNMFPDPASSGETFYEGIKQFPHMHYLSIPLGSSPDALDFVRYWKPQMLKTPAMSEAEQVAGFQGKFMRAVEVRSRADVPMGVFLSGGLDSSSIVCASEYLRESGRIGSNKIHTFSALFPGFERDEKKFVDIILQKVGKDNAHYCLSPDDDLSASLREIQHYHEEPIGPMNVLVQWNLFKLASRQGVKVVFDGLGADELLGGYEIYRVGYMADLLRQGQFGEYLRECAGKGGMRPWGIPSLASSVYQLLPWRLRSNLRNLNRRRRFDYIDSGFRSRMRKWFEVDQRLDPEALPGIPAAGILDRHLLLSLLDSWMNNSVSMAARYSDRSGMANAVESRVPFLDHELVEFVFSTGNEMKFRDHQDKYIQRRAMRGVVPDGVIDRGEKIGFATPAEKWMKGPFSGMMRDFLNDKSIDAHGYVDMKLCRKSYNEFLAGNRPYTPAYWRWFGLFLWLDVCVNGAKSSHIAHA